jgi:hypothetical protein
MIAQCIVINTRDQPVEPSQSVQQALTAAFVRLANSFSPRSSCFIVEALRLAAGSFVQSCADRESNSRNSQDTDCAVRTPRPKPSCTSCCSDEHCLDLLQSPCSRAYRFSYEIDCFELRTPGLATSQCSQIRLKCARLWHKSVLATHAYVMVWAGCRSPCVRMCWRR